MDLVSPAFRDADPIPTKYTKDGENVSPPLAWSELPEGTEQLALVLEDTTQRAALWVLYGIPADAEFVPEGVGHKREPDGLPGARQGANHIGNVGYDGPLGTVGRRARFSFRLYALDEALDLPAGLDHDALMAAISDHVLDEAELETEYERRRPEAA